MTPHHNNQNPLLRSWLVRAGCWVLGQALRYPSQRGLPRHSTSASSELRARAPRAALDAVRGSILIYAMLTMSAMLAMSLTLTSLFISRFRLASSARNAMVALYAADSGAELCLYEARTGTDDPPLVMANTAEIGIVDLSGADINDDCSTVGSSSFGFRSTGSYRGTARTLEISQ